MPPLLCRIGLHKWRNYGDRVLISYKEPGFVLGTKREERKLVHCKRKCLRCGIKEKRRFTDNIDGTLAPIGWVRIVEADEDKTEPAH